MTSLTLPLDYLFIFFIHDLIKMWPILMYLWTLGLLYMIKLLTVLDDCTEFIAFSLIPKHICYNYIIIKKNCA